MFLLLSVPLRGKNNQNINLFTAQQIAAETTLIIFLAQTQYLLQDSTYQAVLSVSMQMLLIDDTSVVS